MSINTEKLVDEFVASFLYDSANKLDYTFRPEVKDVAPGLVWSRVPIVDFDPSKVNFLYRNRDKASQDLTPFCRVSPEGAEIKEYYGARTGLIALAISSPELSCLLDKNFLFNEDTTAVVLKSEPSQGYALIEKLTASRYTGVQLHLLLPPAFHSSEAWIKIYKTLTSSKHATCEENSLSFYIRCSETGACMSDVWTQLNKEQK
jgi:hypothetical protein